MNKLLLAIVVCVFSFGALACDGHGGKEKEKGKDKRIELSL